MFSVQFVCLSAGLQKKNYWFVFHETWQKVVAWSEEEFFEAESESQGRHKLFFHFCCRRLSLCSQSHLLVGDCISAAVIEILQPKSLLGNVSFWCQVSFFTLVDFFRTSLVLKTSLACLYSFLRQLQLPALAQCTNLSSCPTPTGFPQREQNYPLTPFKKAILNLKLVSHKISHCSSFSSLPALEFYTSWLHWSHLCGDFL